MKKLLSLMLVAALLLTCAACGAKAPTWQEQYDLGVRYLSEDKYEEAVIAFLAAIEIDPKQTDAYTALAGAYLAQDDDDAARAALESGYAATGDETLLTRLTQLEPTPEPTLEPTLESTPEPTPDPTPSQTLNSATWGERIGELFRIGYQGDGISIDDVSFMGESIVDPDIMTMESILREKGYKISTNQDSGDSDDDDYYWLSADSNPDGGTVPSIFAFQHYSCTSVDRWGYTHQDYYHGDPIPVGICDIYTQDSMETVLSKLGFENAEDIVEILNDFASVIFPDFDALWAELEAAACYYYYGVAISLGGGASGDEDGGEVEWRGGRGTHYSIGFTIHIYVDGNGKPLDSGLHINFSFENGYLVAVDFDQYNH